MIYKVPTDFREFEEMCSHAECSLPFSNKTNVLSSEISIANKTFNNRVVYQAMEGCDGTADGRPDELTKRRYDRFAKGGPSLIWFEATAVMHEGRANPRQLYINKNNLDAFSKAVESIKSTCMKANGFEPLVICQLTHSGRYSKPDGKPAPRIAYNNPIFEKDAPIDKSAILTDSELDSISEALVNGALLAQKASFDGADIKSCHRYLLSELLSAYERDGRYGGSFENRTRMLLQTTENAVASCSKDFIITTRLNAYDGFPYPYGFSVKRDGSITPDFNEAIALVKELHKKGVRLVNITMGNPYFNPHVNRPFAKGTYDSPIHPVKGVADMLNGTAYIKKAVPEMMVISSALSFLGPLSANVAAGGIENGMFDFGGWGRMTLAYPSLAKDITEKGSLDASKICLACSCCSQIMRNGGRPGCVIRDRDVYGEEFKKYC